MRRLTVAALAWILLPAAFAGDVPTTPMLALDAGGHTTRTTKLLFTPDGKELITVADDKTIRVWDVKSGESLRVLRPAIGRGPEGKLYTAALSPDGRTLAVSGFGYEGGDCPIHLVALDEGRIRLALRGHTDSVHSLAFSPDGRRLASGSGDKTVRIWDTATGRIEQVLAGHQRDVYGLGFSPDGRQLASASFDGTARIWSLADGRTLTFLRGHEKEVRSIIWRPDGKVLATCSDDRSIRLWAANGRSYQGFPDRDNHVTAIAFSADSRRLLYGWGGPATRENGVAILDLESNEERVRFRHDNTVMAVAISPDGTLAASTGGNDQETYLWRTFDGSVVHRLLSEGRTPWSVGWSPDGALIAWGNRSGYQGANDRGPLGRTFRLADLEFGPPPDRAFRRAWTVRGATSLESTGLTTIAVKHANTPVCELKIGDSYEWIRCFSLLPGDRAVVGTVYGLHLFDTRNGKHLRTFFGHTGEIWAVAPSPNGGGFLSSSSDQTVRLWVPERGDPVLSLFVAGDEWVAWTSEGYYAASPGGEKLMGWHVNNGKDRLADFYPAAQFRKSLYRPDVVKLIPRTGSLEHALELADGAKGKASARVEVAEVLPPRVAIVSPDSSGQRFHEQRLTVRAVARSAGKNPVTAVRLLLDGRPYMGQGGARTIGSPALGEVSESWDVYLEPGRHKLAVQADSAVSKAVSEPVEVIVVGKAATDPIDLPSLYVLAVGVSAYPGDLHLNYAAKDAEAVAEVFRIKSGPLFRKVDVRLLTDAKATRIEILRGLSWLKKQMTQKDVAIVFFSGHGEQDGDGSLFLLPVDVDTAELMATGVADDDLKKALAGMPGRIITFLDACHAGAAGGDRRKAVSGLTDDLVRDLVTDDYGVIVMASSMGRESSLESNARRRGYFTIGLTEGLEGQADFNKDGIVYLNELDAYITDRVKELTKGQQHPVTAKPTSIRSFPLARP